MQLRTGFKGGVDWWKYGTPSTFGLLTLGLVAWEELLELSQGHHCTWIHLVSCNVSCVARRDVYLARASADGWVARIGCVSLQRVLSAHLPQTHAELIRDGFFAASAAF